MTNKSDREERSKIIDLLDKNLLVSAGAGSGKTTVLVERMVALIEEGKCSLSKMAALTFTKKAAGEFYDRFYKKLQLRTKPGFDKAKHDKYSLLNNPSQKAIERDKEALNHIDTCFFGTIDAFYQKILNEHPLEAGLSSSATIIDDDEFRNYLIRKFSEYLKSDNSSIREKAEFFSQIIGAASFPEMMSDVLQHMEKEIYQVPDNIETIENLYKEQIEKFKVGCKILANNADYFRPLVDDKEGGFKDVTKDNRKSWDYLISNIGYISSLKNNDYKSASKILKELEKMRFKDDINGLLSRVDFLSLFAVERTSNKKHDGYEIKNSAFRLLNQIKFFRVIDFIKIVKDDIYKSMIDSGYLTFNIATDCLLKLLRNDKDYKNTIDQIRSGIDTLLIDECQDTDMKQYEIFFRLTASNYPGKFEEAQITGGKLYACGDRKQGIYHFRGADVSTYDHIKDIFEEKKKNGLNYDLVTLTDNHRSNGKLIKYFNKTFQEVLKSQGYPPILNDYIKPEDTKYEAYRYTTCSDDDPVNVAKIILQMRRKHNYKYKDFMVITSSKDNIVRYSRAFSALSIPCYSEGKIDIHVSNLLDVVISLFKYIGSNKTDKISLLEVLSSPLFGFDITKTIDTNINFLDAIDLPQFKSRNPSDLLEALAGNPKITKTLNCKGTDVLFGFIHLLKEQENAGMIYSYDDAIKYFQRLQDGDLVVERLSLLANDIDAVQIANAHKTKGLEKKVVILTCAGCKNKPPEKVIKDKYYHLVIGDKRKGTNFGNPYKDVGPISDYVESEEKYMEEENNRLLYVAATRARDFLFIPFNDKNGKVSKTKWTPLLICENEVKEFDILDEVEEKVSCVELKTSEIDTSFNKNKGYKIVAPSKEKAINKFDENYEISSLSQEDALIFGTMVHKLMEFIIKSKHTVLPDSICAYIASSYGREDFANKLLEVKNVIYGGGYPQKDSCYNDILTIAKSCNCYEEVPFSYMDDNKVVNGSIDLVLENDNEVIIVDYKTDVNDIDHTKQLDFYKNAVIKSGRYKDKEIKTIIYNIKK